MAWGTTVGDALRDPARRGWYLGLAAVVLLLGGTGWYQAFDIAPYYQTDEQAHAGYVLALQEGDLPTIDSPIDGADGGDVLQQRLLLTQERNDDVWVANNPPIAYVAALPAATVTRALGLPGGPLLGLRLTNLAFFLVAAVYVARLGRRLSGGDAGVGILAAATFAAVPHVGALSGAGYIDGLALLCSVAIIDALVALSQDGPTRRLVVTLAAWCAIGVGVRPMTAVFAGLAAAMALGLIVLRRPRRARRFSGRGRVAIDEDPPGVIWSAVVLAVPAFVLNGWFYLRNDRLYGDPTGSARLFEKFDRTARDLPLTDVWRHEVWAPPVQALLNRRLPLSEPSDERLIWTWTYRSLIAIAVVTAAIVVVDQVQARRQGGAPRTPIVGWIATVVLLVAVVGLTLEHWQGGGNIHPRYLLFGVVVAAVAVALTLTRLRLRWAVVALVAALLVLQADEIPEMNRSIQDRPWLARAPRVLGSPLGPDWVRFSGIPVMVAGLLVLVVAVIALRDERPSPG